VVLDRGSTLCSCVPIRKQDFFLGRPEYKELICNIVKLGYSNEQLDTGHAFIFIRIVFNWYKVVLQVLSQHIPIKSEA
jgi:hypothetical protein